MNQEHAREYLNEAREALLRADSRESFMLARLALAEAQALEALAEGPDIPDR